MLSVFMLFLIPVGGGIPAGVLLASSVGLPWHVTAGLYFVSDIVLALAFEPLLRLLVAFGRRVRILSRVGTLISIAMARNAAYYSGTGAGPMTLVLISFGVDPMTGRATALAAGHGSMAGWAIAIAGDMLYYAVVALTTLQLNSYVSNPELTILLILGAMVLAPVALRYIRSKLGLRRS